MRIVGLDKYLKEEEERLELLWKSEDEVIKILEERLRNAKSLRDKIDAVYWAWMALTYVQAEKNRTSGKSNAHA